MFSLYIQYVWVKGVQTVIKTETVFEFQRGLTLVGPTGILKLNINQYTNKNTDNINQINRVVNH